MGKTGMKVAVIGLGSMGSMALWRLAAMGAEVDGYEQFAVGHDFGAGGGGTRMFRLVYAEGAAYFDVLRESRILWSDLANRAGHDILIRNGAMAVATADSPQVTRGVQMARDCGVPYEILDARTVSALFPQHGLRPDEVALFDPMGGVIHTERGIRAAAAQAAGLGARIFDYATVTAITPTADGVTVTANGETREYDRVVVSTGPWLNPINERLGFALSQRRVYTTYHRPRDARLLDPRNYPSTIRRCGDQTLATMSSLDGNTVKILIQSDAMDSDVPPDAVQSGQPSRDFLRQVRASMEEFMPMVDPDPVRVAPYPEGFTADGEGVVGIFPGLERIVLMCGFSGAGFKYAPGLGQAAAELALHGKTALIPDGMKPRAWDRPVSDRELVTLWFDVGNH